MNLTQLLGALALTTGASLLLGEVLLSRGLLSDLVGDGVRPFRLVCAIVLVLGAVAVGVGVREGRQH
jgi:hypothetical protein